MQRQVLPATKAEQPSFPWRVKIRMAYFRITIRSKSQIVGSSQLPKSRPTLNPFNQPNNFNYGHPFSQVFLTFRGISYIFCWTFSSCKLIIIYKTVLENVMRFIWIYNCKKSLLNNKLSVIQINFIEKHFSFFKNRYRISQMNSFTGIITV